MPTKRRASKKLEATKTSVVPSGFHTVTPYLTLDRAADAIEFYKNAFGAKELTRETMAGGKILHARIRIGDSIIMMSDEFPESDTKSPSSLGGTTGTLHVYSGDVDKLWQRVVSAGAKVAMLLDNLRVLREDSTLEAGAKVAMLLDNQFGENATGNLSTHSVIAGPCQWGSG